VHCRTEPKDSDYAFDSSGENIALVNDAYQPTLTLRPAKIYRLRMLQATPQKIYDLTFVTNDVRRLIRPHHTARYRKTTERRRLMHALLESLLSVWCELQPTLYVACPKALWFAAAAGIACVLPLNTRASNVIEGACGWQAACYMGLYAKDGDLLWSLPRQIRDAGTLTKVMEHVFLPSGGRWGRVQL
jgi:hypothetical protein